jgi:biopolymer transport protein TolR
MKAESYRGMMAEINVTPLVDVMLVLLIVFMVAAPMLEHERGIDVILPQASTSQPGAGQEALSITLTKEHVIQFQGQVVTIKELRRQLGSQAKQPVMIRADRSAYVSRLVELWDMCRDLGFRQVQIATMSQ